MQNISSVLSRIKNSFFAILTRTGLRKQYLLQKAESFFARYPQNIAANRIKLAFEAFFGTTIYATDREHFSRIKLLRKKLGSDKTVLERADFGAGITGQLHKAKKQITVSALNKGSSMPHSLGKLVYYLVKNTQAQSCLELGTCLGISGSYIGFALNYYGGRLVTVEGDSSSAEIALQNFRELGLYNIDVQVGQFADVLPKVLKDLRAIDFAFIDGHHNGPATIQYYLQLKPYLAEGAVLVFDDIDWSADMQSAWKQLSIFEELYICINLGRMGICIYSGRNLQKATLQLPV